MQVYNWKFFTIVYFTLLKDVYSFELLTIGAIGAGVGSFIYKHTMCKFKECCTKDEIPADFNGLQKILEKKVYGQHIALDVVVTALRAHWNDKYPPQKPLTLSFHGWPGGGKNYVANFIKSSLYTKGDQSRHVHHFIGRMHFPQAEKAHIYQANLLDWVRGNVSNCPKQLFIFDEVEKIPPTVINFLKPLLDYNPNVDKIDYRKSIFIFLSNTGASLITERYIELWKSGVLRKNVKLKDFENLITKGVFNEAGGFHHSDTIRSNLIDHYVPFLPMQEEQVRYCIINEFRHRGVNYPSDKEVAEVLEFVEWGPDPDNLFSKTGCKRISQKVANIVFSKRTR